ncbi:MAG: hypothetical protein M0Z58_07690 [Nitrospiraceae bacterium]|nr:hypothetical protein [Nitrospiraceae bacterium]
MALKRVSLALLFLFFTGTAGCGGLLPSTRKTVQSPWVNFYQAKHAYDQIEVEKSTAKSLRDLGFDPYINPNVQILTYVDIIQRFMFNPSIRMKDLAPGLQRCIRAGTECRAYSITPGITSDVRKGNFFLDFFNFKRHIHETGWNFQALVVMVDDTVVYKQWGGNPAIDSTTITKNPLGPLQSAGDLLINMVKP